MDATRELKLKLTVEAPDPSKPSKAFQDIAAQAQKASLAVQDANKQMQRLQAPGGMGLANSGGIAGGGGSGVGIAGSSISWTRPGFTGAPSSISWTRPGFTGSPSPAGPILPTVTPLAVPQILQGPGSAIQGARPGGPATSSVSAFDRPQAVVIVGPKPLPVAVVGGSVGGGGVAGATGGIGGPKPASSAGGLMTGLAGAAGTVAAIATTAAAFGNLTEAVAQASQPTTTAADRFTLLSQAMAKSVPIIGDSLGSILGSLQNAAGRLTDWKGSLARDKYRGEFPLRMAEDAIKSRGLDQVEAANRMPRAARAAVASQEQFPTLAYQAATKTGLSGALGRASWESKDEREKAAMEGVQAAKRSLAEADAAATAAKRDERVQKSRAADADEMVDIATLGRKSADRRAGVGGAGAAAKKPSSLEQWAGTLVPGLGVGMGLAGRGPLAEIGKQQVAKDERAQQLLVEQRAITQALKEQERLMAAQERSGQASLEAAKKRNELSKAETALMKTRIDLMQEELQKSRGATREFNGMDSVAQRDFASTFERFKTGGRDALTNEEFSQLQSSNITGDFVNKRLEKEGGDKPNAILSGLMKDVGLKDAQTLEAQIGKAKAELAVKVQVDEENFRKVMKEEMEKLNSDLTGMIKKIVSTELKLEDTKFAAGRATAS